MSKSKIDGMIKEWDSTHSPQRIGEKHYMLLSLGHEYLDSLADPLFFERWDIIPHEICAKIKELGGDLHQPWQTFEVKSTVLLQYTEVGFNEQELVTWLALCGEIHPEWREALNTACARELYPRGGIVARIEVRDLYSNLRALVRLPASMVTMFEKMLDMKNMPKRTEETH